MNDQFPDNIDVQVPNNTVEQPVRTTEEFASAHQADNAAMQAEFGEAMSEEDRSKQIGQAVFELAMNDPEGQECLGQYVEHETFPDGPNKCLYDYEQKKQSTNPDFDVTTQSPKRLARILQRGLVTVEKTAGIEEKTETAEITEEKDASYAAQKELWKNDENWQAKFNQAKVADMLAHPDVPESEKAKWQDFHAILTIASANEVDKAIVTASFEQVDIFNAPSAESFARSFIFDSPDSQIKTGVSDATQQAVAESLGITLPKEEPKTGGDVNDLYAKGGTETYTDENGEKQTRAIPLPKDARVPFTEESELGFDQRGNKTAWVQTQGGEFQVKLPDNPTDRELGDILRTTQLRGKLHALNIAHIVYPDVTIEERGGGPITVQPWHYAITNQFLETVVSNRAVAGNNLLSQSDLDKIPYVMQFHDRKGDAGIADVNPEQTVEDYRAQGIIDKSGALDWERFNALVMANRSNLYTEANFKANTNGDDGENLSVPN